MIAHKLETAVRYCEKILVMDQGSTVEFDSAKNLLKLDANNEIRGTGLFVEMIRSLNHEQQQRIFDIINDKS